MRARTYTIDEVRQILRSSQGRVPPEGAGWRRTGHAADHVNPGKERLGEIAREHLRNNPDSAKSSFLSFADQVQVATDLLNSPEGQRRLRELDDRGPGSRVTIASEVTAPVVIHFNMSGMRDDTRRIPWLRFICLVAATQDSIYIHTCYADVVVR